MKDKIFLKTILVIFISALLLAPILVYGAESMSVYLRSNYRYALWLGGALSVMMIIFSGVTYAISLGDVDSINKSKERLAGAIVGFLLLLLTYLIMESLSSNYTDNTSNINTAPFNSTQNPAENKSNPIPTDAYQLIELGPTSPHNDL